MFSGFMSLFSRPYHIELSISDQRQLDLELPHPLESSSVFCVPEPVDDLTQWTRFEHVRGMTGMTTQGLIPIRYRYRYLYKVLCHTY